MARTYSIADERGIKFQYTGQLVTEECPSCHIVYAIPRSLFDLAQERSLASPEETLSVYCPSGHSWHYMGKNEEQRLRAELTKQQRANDDLLDRLTTTEKDRRRVVKRATNGVCVECNRTFQNLLRHMKTKHGHEPEGSLSGLLVHKRREPGGGRVKCTYKRTPAERSAYRWADVDCPQCLATRPSLPA